MDFIRALWQFWERKYLVTRCYSIYLEYHGWPIHVLNINREWYFQRNVYLLYFMRLLSSNHYHANMSVSYISYFYQNLISIVPSWSFLDIFHLSVCIRGIVIRYLGSFWDKEETELKVKEISWTSYGLKLSYKHEEKKLLMPIMRIIWIQINWFFLSNH